MPVDFTYVVGNSGVAHAGQSETNVLSRVALAGIAAAGFNAILLDTSGDAERELDAAERLVGLRQPAGVIATHWAGALAPTTAARRIAELDRKAGGRLSVRLLGAPRGEGDDMRPSGHAAVWQRLDEYVVLLKRLWANDCPIDHEGTFYSVRSGHVPRKGPSGAGLEIRMAGLSGTALRVVARHADVFELAPGSLSETRLLIGRVRAAAAEHGRAARIRFALPVRLGGEASAAGAGESRTVDFGGEPGQVALKLLPFVSLGVSEFLLSGIGESCSLGQAREVVSLVRNSAARHENAPGMPFLADEPARWGGRWPG